MTFVEIKYFLGMQNAEPKVKKIIWKVILIYAENKRDQFNVSRKFLAYYKIIQSMPFGKF